MAAARLHGRSRFVRRLTIAGALLTAVLLLVSAAEPSRAQAVCLDPNSCLGDLAASFAKGFRNPFESPFITWLVRVPNYATSAQGMGPIETSAAAIGLAVLSATATLSGLQHWASGIAGGGDITHTVTRTAGAGLMILGWPWVFSSGIDLSNAVAGAILPVHQVNAVEKAFGGPAAAVGGGIVVTLSAGVILALMYTVVALTKLALNAGLAAGYVGVPLALALWPLPGMSWLPTWLLKVVTAAVAVSIAWAVVFAALAGVGIDALKGDTGGLGNFVTAPLVLIMLFVLLMKVSGMILRTAGLVSSGGMARAIITFAASRAVGEWIRGHSGQATQQRQRQQMMDARREQEQQERVQRQAAADTKQVQREGQEKDRAWREAHAENEARDAAAARANMEKETAGQDATYGVQIGLGDSRGAQEGARAATRLQAGRQDPREAVTRNAARRAYQQLPEDEQRAVRGSYERHVLEPLRNGKAGNYDALRRDLVKQAASVPYGDGARLRAYRTLARTDNAVLTRAIDPGPGQNTGPSPRSSGSTPRSGGSTPRRGPSKPPSAGVTP